jgi:Tol biopolymer transport system component
MRRKMIGFVLTALLLSVGMTAQQKKQAEVDLQAAIRTENLGDLKKAIKQYEGIVKKYSKDGAVAAQALIHMAASYEKLGDNEARKIYERVVREYKEQMKAVAEARQRLEVMSGSEPPDSPSQPTHTLVSVDGASYTGFDDDGRLFLKRDQVTGDLAVQDMLTGNVRRLFVVTRQMNPLEGGVFDATISPDGRRVVYYWRPGRNNGQLKIVATDPGSQSKLLVDNPEFTQFQPVDWSTDMNSVLVLMTRPDGTWDLSWVSTRDGTVKRIKSLGWRVRSGRPSISPDGRYIAYSALAKNPGKATGRRDVVAAPDSADEHVYVLSVDGSVETEVVKGGGVNESPVWTPDGQRILFVSNRAGNFTLWSVPILNGKATGGETPLLVDTGRIVPKGISRSGAFYYTKTNTPKSAVYVATLDKNGKIGAPSRFSEDLGTARKPAWSPDGKSIAFWRNAPNDRAVTSNQLVIRSVETGTEQIKTVNAANGTPIWFNHEAAFLYQAPGLFRLDVTPGQSRPVKSPVVLGPAIALAPDDKTIYLAGLRPDPKVAAAPLSPAAIVSMNLDTGEQKQVWSSQTPMTFYDRPKIALSPDGRTLAMTFGPSPTPLVRIDIDGGNYRELSTSAVAQGPLEWSKDGKYIFFSSNSWQLMRIHADGSTPAEPTGLQFSGGVDEHFSIDPTGSRVAFSHATASTELWALDNLSSLWKTR